MFSKVLKLSFEGSECKPLPAPRDLDIGQLGGAGEEHAAGGDLRHADVAPEAGGGGGGRADARGGRALDPGAYTGPRFGST